jgi:CheY-like chemotaxis protein
MRWWGMTETHKRVLCIEDDKAVAEMIAEELGSRGFDVTVAHNGRAVQRSL